MSPTAPNSYAGIEDDLRVAFRAAAAAIDTAEPIHHIENSSEDPSPGLRVVALAPAPPRARRRWVAPAVAAAVVIAVGAPIVALTIARNTAGPDIAAASAVQVDGAHATVAGIGFPVPSGWSVAVVGHDATSVTACVAASPSVDCAGVTVRIAVPDARGRITPLPDAVSQAADRCPQGDEKAGSTYVLLDEQLQLNGGLALHESVSCGEDGPPAGIWSITDGSLAITTPPGAAASQAASIAAGLDFSGYAHRFGPQIAFVSPADGPGAAATSALSALPAPTR